MSASELSKGGYVTCIYNDDYPFGMFVNRYNTLEEAREHIKFQKDYMNSKDDWHIIYVESTIVE